MSARVARLLALAAVALAVAGCTTEHDVGSTPQEQLCNVLRQPAVETGSIPDGFLYEPLLESAAADPGDLPLELQVIAITYQTKQDAYDQLGPYEPAIQFADELNQLAAGGLIGPSTLSPRVLESALAIDQALDKDGCE